MSYNSTTRSGPGSSLGDADKTLNVDALSVFLISEVMNFKIDLGVTKISLGSLFPDGIETILMAVVAGEINRVAMNYFDLTERANTDTIAYSVCDKMWNKAWDYVSGEYPQKAQDVAGGRSTILDAMQDYELMMLFATVPGGVGYVYAVGNGPKNPGKLTSYLSDSMEDIASDELGLDLSEPTWVDDDMDVGAEDVEGRDSKGMGYKPSITEAAWMGRWREINSRLREAPPDQPPAGAKFPIMIAAAAGIAALILFKKK